MAAESVLDIGSGVGLPGIPLAILRPQTAFRLLDRSGRRTDLAARAVRVLDLPNVSVTQGDLATLQDTHDGIVMRSVLRPQEAFPVLRRLLRPDTSATMGLSRRGRDRVGPNLTRGAAEHGLSLEVVEVPVLDSPTTLLRMTRHDDVI